MTGENEKSLMDLQSQSPSQNGKGRRIYVLAAWASLLAGIIIALVLWLWMENYQGARGQRPIGILLFYLVLLLANVAGFLAGLVSLILGVRSRREALLIIPAAVLGICSNGYCAGIWLLAFLLEGRNLGG
jgi:peptidoglycan biosynthesis protein MviN/MurJ (putative lipid II flippase)